MKYLVSLFALLFCVVGLSAQIGANGGAAYQVEFDKFSPPVKEMIAEFEGFPAIPFIANDQHNSEINLASLKGNAVLLCFVDTNNPTSLKQMEILNRMAKRYRNQAVRFIAFNQGSRAHLMEYLSNHPVGFSMIPHAGIFGEGPYGGELGYPRLFFIDSFGIIKKVLPAEVFADPAFDLTPVLDGLIGQYSGQ